MRFGNREYRIALIGITIVLALPILMHVINGLNSRMLADDFCFAASVQNKGFAGAMNFYYYNWQGTFSSTAVQTAVALSGGWLVPWLPAAMVIGWWIGLFLLIWQFCELLRFQLPRLSAFALATLMLYTILQGTPTVFQSIYWTSGSVTYTVPMVLFTLGCAALLYITRKTLSSVMLVIVWGVTVVGAGLLAGFSPIFAVFEIAIFGLLFVVSWFRRPESFGRVGSILIAGLIGALIGMVIMVAAPGNSARQALYHKPDNLLALLGVNVVSTASYVGIDLSAFSLVPHLVLLIVGGWIIGKGMVGNSDLYNRVKRSPRKWLAAALGVALLLLFGIFLPTSYNISGFPPGRALIIPHFVMVVLVLTWSGIMAFSLKRTATETGRVSVWLVCAIVSLLVIGPLLSGAKALALSPKFQTFAAEWDARDALIRRTKNESEPVSVPPFSVDLADYVNVGAVEGEFVSCLQDYYHIRQLVVKK
ncbi:MAG: hypothetical protein GC179_16585 [Anaerolineaceae bacterium]|nr:hypothetical protein [Anaerolineaceae bacterium]